MSRTKNPYQDDGGHPLAGVNQSDIEGIHNTFNFAENPKFLKRKLERRFRVSPGYACLLIELAYCGSFPR